MGNSSEERRLMIEQAVAASLSRLKGAGIKNMVIDNDVEIRRWLHLLVTEDGRIGQGFPVFRRAEYVVEVDIRQIGEAVEAMSDVIVDQVVAQRRQFWEFFAKESIKVLAHDAR